MPAASSTICIGSAYCRTKDRHQGSFLASAKRFRPYFSRRRTTSASSRPRWRSTCSASSASGTERTWNAGASPASGGDVMVAI
jgi:hypothetical protein